MHVRTLIAAILVVGGAMAWHAPASAQPQPAAPATQAAAPSPDSDKIKELEGRLKEATDKLAKHERNEVAEAAHAKCYGKDGGGQDSCNLDVAITFHDTPAGAQAKDAMLADLARVRQMEGALKNFGIAPETLGTQAEPGSTPGPFVGKPITLPPLPTASSPLNHNQAWSDLVLKGDSCYVDPQLMAREIVNRLKPASAPRSTCQMKRKTSKRRPPCG